ncbi:adenylate/guanylate cyclase domain-containing protein [Hoeflea sp. TYP-13]|uniref:adenylate/guanylate cyclase domain-containing protein n=1 Tax=Hoeflea sp. TYP-13 TaxID=3230023 RepID=UPI0034C5EFA3
MKLSEAFAYDPDDPAEVRAEKFAIFLVSISCCVAGLVWSAMYYAVFGAGLTAALPALFVLIVGSSLAISHLFKNHLIAAYSQIICIIYITTFSQWSIGGVVDSGFVMIWALCGPVIALMYFSVRESAVWLALYLINIAITVAFEGYFSAHGQAVSDGTKTLFFLMNLSFASVVVFVFARFFVQSTIREREKSNALLLNILPEKTARTLKSGEGIVAEKHDEVSILFADIVEFTKYASRQKPEEIVSKLNDIFSHFDTLVEDHDLEKIKTIGDAYMVVGGLTGTKADHAGQIADLALDMMASIDRFKRESGVSFSLRIGLHTGPVVAGVIGRSKFAYDLWGDTVNVASRMESTGVDGAIQVSEAMRRALNGRFEFEKRGSVEVKGRGLMDTYILQRRI